MEWLLGASLVLNVIFIVGIVIILKIITMPPKLPF